MSQDDDKSVNAMQGLPVDESTIHQLVSDASPKPRGISPAKRKRVFSHVEITDSVNRYNYEVLPGKDTVHKILEEYNIDDEVVFKVQFGDYHEEIVRTYLTANCCSALFK